MKKNRMEKTKNWKTMKIPQKKHPQKAKNLSKEGEEERTIITFF